MTNLRRQLVLGFLALQVAAAGAQLAYVEREISIPWVKAAPSGLDSLLVYVDLPGKHPLAVLTHGTSRKAEERAQMSPWSLLPEALWFARRGWVVLVVVRRGYGGSGGEEDGRRSGRCPATDYEAAAEYGAEDLRIAIDYARGLPQVDQSEMIAAGVSTGGLVATALTVNPPRGLVAAINFAGGRGSRADHDVCNPGDLVSAYKEFGKRSRTPMLWLYAENDKYFWPELAQRFDAAFRSQGGLDQFVLAPAIGEDGHALFRHPDAWSSTVESFLVAQKLAPLAEPLGEPRVPDLPAPAGLGEQGLKAFHDYLLMGPHKAFAISEHHYGYVTANRSLDDARKGALERCDEAAIKDPDHKEKCALVYADEAPVRR